MSQSIPETLPEWREFLRGYSDDFLRVAGEEDLEGLDDSHRENRWLGYEPATEEEVRAAEERLGERLPPSYRNFLLASNGWRGIGPMMYELVSVDEIGWLHETAPDVIDVVVGGREDAERLLGRPVPGREDERLLWRSVLLSGPADGDYWLLDGNDIGPDGEWTAYEWPVGDGGQPEPYPSFGALVADLRASFEELRGQEGHPVHPEGADELLAEGRRQALAGNVEAAEAALQAAHSKGSALAPYLAGLLLCCTDPGPTAESHIRNAVLNDRVLSAVDEMHLRAELIPLYLNVWRDGANHEPAFYAARVADYLPPVDPAVDPAVDPVVATDAPLSPRARVRAEGEVRASRAARYVPPVLPENPAFQRELDRARELIAAGDNGAAWAVIEQALPLWEPDSPYRIAPLILRVDPVFRPVVTPDRYRTLVATPRGGAER